MLGMYNEFYMSDITDSVNQVLQDYKQFEASSNYKEYREFSKVYESLIKKGFTQRRESQLKTIQDQGGQNWDTTFRAM